MASPVPTRLEKIVRFTRRVQACAAAFALAALLNACSSGSDDATPTTNSQGSTSVAPASPEGDQLQTIPAPITLPGGEWTAAGDLCTILPANMATELLGHNGTLVAEYNSQELPGRAGIDVCRYTNDPPNGLTVLVSVSGGVTDDVWAKTEGYFQTQKSAYGFTKYESDGVGGVLVNDSQEVVVRKGEIMVSALNSSPRKFDQQALATFAVVVAHLNIG